MQEYNGFFNNFIVIRYNPTNLIILYMLIYPRQTNMKVFITICAIALISACGREQDNTLQEKPDTISYLSPSEINYYHLDTIEFTPILLDTCHLKLSEIFIGSTDGGPIIWSVFFSFYDSARTQNPNFFSFRYYDKNNNPDNFGNKGLHLETGEISNGLQYNTFSLGPVTSNEIEYYLDKALVKSDASHNFEWQGSGYVKIKQRIYWKWPRRIWNGEKYILPGDSSYLSYGIPIYYEPATLYFNNIK